MEKPKVSAKGISKDIKTGLSNSQIRLKYGLTEKQLESIFRKLVSAGLFTDAELSASKEVSPAPPPISGNAEAVLADLKAGVHKMEIMSRHELSPSQYEKIVEELVQSGDLPQSGIEEREAVKTTKCRFCSARVPVDQEQCPSCHQWLDGRDATPERIAERLQPPRIAAQGIVSDKYCPWDEVESLGVVNAFFQTCVKCLASPGSFFSEMPLDKGYLKPLAFGMVVVWFGIFLTLLWGIVIRGGGGFLSLLISAALMCALSAPGAILMLSVWALLVHGCLLIVRGSHSGMQATFRVVCYASCTQVLGIIPYVGSFIGFVYGVVLSIIGLKETHDTSTGKAVAAVLMPLATVVLIAVIPALFVSTGADLDDGPALDYSEAQLPKELCEAIVSCIAGVDDAVSLGDHKAMQREVQESMNRFNQAAKEFSNHPDIREVSQKLSLFAGASLLQAMFKDRLDALPPRMREKKNPEPYRNELMGMCGQ